MRPELPLSALAGALLGALLRWMSAPALPDLPPAPEIVLEVSQRPLTEACPDRRQAIEAELSALRGELDALALTARVLEAQRAEREGTPVSWPEQPGDLAPAAFESAMRAALAASGEADLVALDCEEYPCIAAVASRTLKDNGDALLVPFEGLSEELETRGYDQERAIGGYSGNAARGEGYQAYQLLVFGGDDEPMNTKIRAGFRIEKRAAEVEAELEAR